MHGTTNIKFTSPQDTAAHCRRPESSHYSTQYCFNIYFRGVHWRSRYYAAQVRSGNKVDWNNNITANIMEQSPSWKADSSLATVKTHTRNMQ